MSQEYLNGSNSGTGELDNDKSYSRTCYGAISSTATPAATTTTTTTTDNEDLLNNGNNRSRTVKRTSPPSISSAASIESQQSVIGGTSPSIPSSSRSLSQYQMRSTLSFLKKIGFGLGHIYNDLCAGVWFSYTLLFMQATLLIPAPEAGALVMLGQISDAISTPIVGILADRYGTKRQWHIFGTGLVFISFPMIFSLCPWCSTAPHWWPPIYFSIFIIIFQFAWAVVQISHLSMIPEMSITIKDRADLTATRYSASVCSNVIVYIVTWILLQGHNKFDTNIGPIDAYRFRDISLILTLMGLTMSILFHFSLSLSGYEKRRQLALAAHRNQIENNESTITGHNDHDDNNDDYDNNSIIDKERTIGTRRLSRGGDRRGSSLQDSGNATTTTTTTLESEEITASETDRLIDNSQNDGNNHDNDNDDDDDDDDKLIQNYLQNCRRKNFLKSPLLYINAFLYVFSRLFMTTSLVYMPLWLDEASWQLDTNPSSTSTPQPSSSSSSSSSLISALSTRISISSRTTVLVQGNSGIDHLATVPLVSFLASFVASLILKHVNRWIGHQLAYFIGSIICIIGCIWIAMAVPTTFSLAQLFTIAILFGAGSSITMISSLCITADMIGRHTYQGGFIYSAVTFADKFITGIVVVIIETIKCKKREDCPEYYKNVLAYGCGIAAVLGIIILFLLKFINSITIAKRNARNM